MSNNPYGGNPYGGAPQGQPNPYGAAPAGQPYAQPAQQQPAYNQPPAQPAYNQAPPPAQQPGTFTCPKCRGVMRTYQRNSIQIEQCDGCRGIFLDFGELESLTRLEGTMMQAPPPAASHGYAPGWSNHGRHHYHQQGFSRLFFST